MVSAAEQLNLMLPGVSRTFALTIPQLPADLRPGITNAYLLCRTADTIEDSADLGPEAKSRHYRALLQMLDGELSAEAFGHSLLGATHIPAATERDLLRAMPVVVEAYAGLPGSQRLALRRCVGVMCEGMERFEHLKNPTGLTDRNHFREYCYVVAGVVGEFLTELFCQADATTAGRRDDLLRLAPGFGQGLQMTNILKDVWDDRQRGICWLPRDVFLDHGHPLQAGQVWHDDRRFQAAMLELVGVAHHHLRMALAYTQAIPTSQPGIRRFCAWAVGIALLTLQRIRRNPGFQASAEAKISRRTLRGVVAGCNLSIRSNQLLDLGFGWAARGLPLACAQTLPAITAREGAMHDD
jgi:farnesyl-diphosphate farnesyltransferase